MKISYMLAGLTAAIALTACGGGGAGSSAAEGNVSLYLGDSFREDYSQVWLTVHRVEFRDAGTGVYATSFSAPGGLLLDAKRLRDASGIRFAFAAKGSLPQGSYDNVRVTLGNDVVLVPTGSTNGQTYQIHNSLARDASNNPMATFALSPPVSVPAAQPVVIDFDLANFAIVGGMVMPALARGDDSTISNPNRHEIEDYKGTVSNLTSTSFRLLADVGAPFNVTYDQNTPVYRSSTGAPMTLANGQRVEVRGFFVGGGASLTAVSIKVEDGGGGGGQAEVRGSNTNINLGAKTYTLANIQGVQGFLPQGSTVNVVWTSSTVFRRSGVVVGPEQLNNWPFSEVKGSYSSATNTLTATRITLENNLNGEPGGEAEAKGDISQVDLNANTMVLLNIRNIEGFSPQGTTVNVTWTNDTVFRRSGNVVTENALLQWPIAKVKGLYVSATNTIQASRITLDDD